MAALLRDPYTSQCYWWAPSELLRRLLFILLINIVPSNLVCIHTNMLSRPLELFLCVGTTATTADGPVCTVHIHYAVSETIC